mmetsp:Transcript_8115/g.26510  ORF Transcript_8115/g.26510 Transcript_8115/m.26510 type:complete len:269 (-) Transcript_8115:542-1348(-)
MSNIRRRQGPLQRHRRPRLYRRKLQRGGRRRAARQRARQRLRPAHARAGRGSDPARRGLDDHWRKQGHGLARRRHQRRGGLHGAGRRGGVCAGGGEDGGAGRSRDGGGPARVGRGGGRRVGAEQASGRVVRGRPGEGGAAERGGRVAARPRARLRLLLLARDSAVPRRDRRRAQARAGVRRLCQRVAGVCRARRAPVRDDRAKGQGRRGHLPRARCERAPRGGAVVALRGCDAGRRVRPRLRSRFGAPQAGRRRQAAPQQAVLLGPRL